MSSRVPVDRRRSSRSTRVPPTRSRTFRPTVSPPSSTVATACRSMGRSSTTSVSMPPPGAGRLPAVSIRAISPPASRSPPSASRIRRRCRALTARPRRTPSTRSSSRVKPVPTVRLRSSTVSPPPCASQLKSRRPVSGPSSMNPGTVEVGAAAGADGVVRVSRPAANPLATTARTSRAAPTAPAAGSRARSRLAAWSARRGWGCPGRAAGTASSSRPHAGQDPPGLAARSSSQRGHHACLPPPMVASSRSAGRARWC